MSPSAADSVTLWERPADGGGEVVVAGKLPVQTQAVVVETFGSATGEWLRVRPSAAPGPLGWTPSSNASSSPPPVPEPPPPPLHDERWVVLVSAGGAFCGPSDLNLEYHEGGFRAEVTFLSTPKGLGPGLAVGFRNFEGNPRFNYVGSTTYDDPRNSSLEMFDLGLRFGQWSGGPQSGARWWWSLGPTATRVYEEAEVHVRRVSDGSEIAVHQQWLARWAPAGDLRVGIGFNLPRAPFSVGLQAGGYIIAWDGKEQRPLTSDYLGKRSIHGMDITLTFGFFNH